MDLIYERAYLTVVAANSPSANSGLPGVMAPRRLEQKVYHMKPNLSFAILSPLGVHLKKSTWGSRGWTLQEQHLSRRTLNFVNNQVYFQCRESLWSEDRTTDRRPEGKTHLDMDDQLINIIKESMDEMLDSTSPYELLFTILETFQKRTLTLDSDAYNAVAGFLPRVAEAGNTDMVEGLPTKIFPGFLLCYNRGGNLNLPAWEPFRTFSDEARRRTEFPSWSWTGWRAPSYWRIGDRLGTAQDRQDTVEWVADAN